MKEVSVMMQLAAWTFDEEDGARRIEPTLGRLADQHRFVLRDARVLSWAVGGARPAARRVYSVPLTAAIDDIVWGLLLGQVLYGDAGSRSAPLAAIGIGTDVVQQLSSKLGPGRSGLIVIGDDDNVQQLADALAPDDPHVRIEVPGDVHAALESRGRRPAG